MIFFNQPRSPCGGLSLTALAGIPQGFDLSLERLPQWVERLVFVAAIDGPGTMSQLTSARALLFQNGRQVASVAFQGTDFDRERALMLVEIYRKDGLWRIAATGQGFEGGLDALVRHFGGEVAGDAPPPPRLSLEKRVEHEAPHLLNLAKTATISLKKRGLQDTLTRVGLVLDASGSMNAQYKSGRVQELLDRVLPLALHFDDDGSLDVWAFDNEAIGLPPATTATVQGYTSTAGGSWKRWGGGTNDEPKAVRLVFEHYRRDRAAPPAYVIFVSDGGVHKNKELTKLMVEASGYPIFWQFMGLGGRNYGILEKLDTLPGRVVDNCGFFSLDDLRAVSEESLYDRLLQEFPLWLRAARDKGIVP